MSCVCALEAQTLLARDLGDRPIGCEIAAKDGEMPCTNGSVRVSACESSVRACLLKVCDGIGQDRNEAHLKPRKNAQSADQRDMGEGEFEAQSKLCVPMFTRA